MHLLTQYIDFRAGALKCNLKITILTTMFTSCRWKRQKSDLLRTEDRQGSHWKVKEGRHSSASKVTIEVPDCGEGDTYLRNGTVN